MSRKSNSRSTTHDHNVLDADHNSHQAVQNVIALYGDQAPTAAAWCAFTAWCEGDEGDYRFWSRIFLSLRN